MIIKKSVRSNASHIEPNGVSCGRRKGEGRREKRRALRYEKGRGGSHHSKCSSHAIALRTVRSPLASLQITERFKVFIGAALAIMGLVAELVYSDKKRADHVALIIE
jgi:hypothetical protein